MPTIMRTLKLLTVVGVMSLLSTPLHAQAFKVIANSSVTTSEVPAAALSKVFLKQSKKLPDGTAVTPVDLAKDSPVREAFTKAVHGRAVSAVETFWQQQIFSGKEVPPATKNSDADIIAFVKSTPGAIAYVSAGAATDGVKVIAVK
jgi:ABC-type phosphate transport system substrate-binding protein